MYIYIQTRQCRLVAFQTCLISMLGHYPDNKSGPPHQSRTMRRRLDPIRGIIQAWEKRPTDIGTVSAHHRSTQLSGAVYTSREAEHPIRCISISRRITEFALNSAPIHVMTLAQTTGVCVTIRFALDSNIRQIIIFHSRMRISNHSGQTRVVAVTEPAS